MINKPHILASCTTEILDILKNIVKNDEDSTSLIDYPVLIGSRAAKWHISSFREPNNWNLVATIPQSISFINKINSNAMLKNIKLIYYPESALKIVGECTESERDTILFDIELISDKYDLRKMKPNKKKSDTYNEDDDYIDEKNCDDEYDSYEYSSKENSDEDSTHSSSDEDSDNEYSSNDDDNIYNDDETDETEFERFENTTSTLMIIELCRDINDKIMFPFLPSFLCIVAPLKILEALKASHINCLDNFQKNITDLHILRASLSYNNMLMTQPLCSPQRDEQIEIMLKTRIKETEIIQEVLQCENINLNIDNEKFLDHDKVFLQSHNLHNDIHEHVKYGKTPIYKNLITDKV
jgi:hypothetical protein